jgi:hypothetical protein
VIYLITFACYGCHLYGNESGSVDREHNVPGTPNLEADGKRAAAAAERMDQAPYHLDQIRRDAVLEAIQEVCGHRGSRLPAAHARSNHVHAVVNAGVPPERVMSDFKAYSSRRLNKMRLDQPNRKRRAHHGCGNPRMSRRRFSMSLPSRVTPWLCSSLTILNLIAV